MVRKESAAREYFLLNLPNTRCLQNRDRLGQLGEAAVSLYLSTGSG